LAGGHFALAEQTQDFTAGGIAQGLKGSVHGDWLTGYSLFRQLPKYNNLWRANQEMRNKTIWCKRFPPILV
ncbi:MAG TPA: hypothetical protein VGJ04_04585, partial [Pirellulales bacterium]